MATIIGSGGVEFKLKCHPRKFFNSLVHSTHVFPSQIPQFYESVTATDALGDIRSIKFGPGAEKIKQSEDEITEREWPTLAYRVLSGDIRKADAFTSFSVRITIYEDSPGSGHWWVKWSWIYQLPEFHGGEVKDIEYEYANIAFGTLEKLDFVLSKN